jgi:hypothetical protein
MTRMISEPVAIASHRIPEHSQDGYSPTRTTLAAWQGTRGAWVHVKVDCLPDGRMAWWRTPSARVMRGWVDTMLADTGYRRVGRREYVAGSWTYRYEIVRVSS